MNKLAFEPHKVKTLSPIGKTILVIDMNFETRITSGGIILPNDDAKSSGIRPRWAQVYAVGPEHDIEEIIVGKYILISHGRWSRGIDIEDEIGKKTIRKIDPNDILLISDEPVNDDTMSDKVY